MTFFAAEVFDEARRKFGVPQLSPAAFRRNIITEGVDLNSLIGERFTLQGVTFLGMEECRPCHWMEQAVAPGAEHWLKGQGGLRARVITTGVLWKDAP